jgi:8-oxo-dGTP pyrophosphatase MutT (NUDIX family)
LIANKVCPVVLRSIGSTVDVLAFEHPLAGYQLVKGTVEAGEALEAAALRELGEESGITSASVVRNIGTWSSGFENHVWAFFQCQPADVLPEAWQHHAPDDGGHAFRFFWHPLFAHADPGNWHLLFRNALSFIQRSIV